MTRRKRRRHQASSLELTTECVFPQLPDQSIVGSIGDSAPDTWGAASRSVRTLGELDYLLGVEDETRLGAPRFR